MTEATIETKDRFSNPKGKKEPVFYDQVVETENGLRPRRLRIVDSSDQKLDYMAVDPKTGEKIDLKKEDWESIYRGSLNENPPVNLAERLKKPK